MAMWETAELIGVWIFDLAVAAMILFEIGVESCVKLTSERADGK